MTKFLDANEGPGLQHVALAVDNIVKAVNECSAAGIEFINSPIEYYDNLASILLINILFDSFKYVCNFCFMQINEFKLSLLLNSTFYIIS